MAEFLLEFIQTNGVTIIMAIFTAVASFIGTQIKNIYESKVQDDKKKKAVETVCKAVNQMYKELDGDEKLQKAIEGITAMLNEKGIQISEVECRMLIEATVYSFKTSIVSDKNKENVALEESEE